MFRFIISTAVSIDHLFTMAGSQDDILLEDLYISKPVEYFSVSCEGTTALNEFLQELATSKKYSDVEVFCQGILFQSHRIILMAHSKYFRRHFDNHLTTCCHIDGDPAMFEILLNYMYTGQLCVEKKVLKSLAEMAGRLGISRVKDECDRSTFAGFVPTVENCVDIFRVGEATQDAAMINKVLPLVLENFSSLQDDPVFMDLPISCIKKCLLHPNLAVDTPDQRLSFGIRWLKQSPSHRRFTTDLLKALPLGNMKDWFLRHILLDPMFNNDAQAVDIINRAIAKQKLDACAADSGGSAKFIVLASSGLQSTTKEIAGVQLNPSSSTKYLPRIPGEIPKHGSFACANDSKFLFISGLGTGRNETWRLDLKTMKWRMHGLLKNKRLWHCMAVMESKVYVFGGRQSNSVELDTSVESLATEVHNTSTQWHQSGKIKGTTCLNTLCKVIKSSEVVIVGARVDGANKIATKQMAQIYSSYSQKVTHTLEWFAPACWVFGMVITSGMMVIGSADGFYTCPVEALYAGDARQVVALRKNLRPPNLWCGMVLNDESELICLLGGTPRSEQAKQYVYSCPAEELLKKKNARWSVGHRITLVEDTKIMPSTFWEIQFHHK